MTIFTLTSVGVPIAFGSTQYFTAKQNVGQVKSFVDDLVMKLGTVSMRVALVLRSAEVQPVFQDLCIGRLLELFGVNSPPLSFSSPLLAAVPPRMTRRGCGLFSPSALGTKKNIVPRRNGREISPPTRWRSQERLLK